MAFFNKFWPLKIGQQFTLCWWKITFRKLLNPETCQQGQDNVSLCLFFEKYNIQIPKISEDNNTNLSADISDQQVYEAISKLNKNSSSGPDCFTPKLFIHYSHH